MDVFMSISIWATSLFCCVVLIGIYHLYVKNKYYTSSGIVTTYTENDCKSMMRGIIIDWVDAERKIIQPMAEVTGSDINFIYNLNMINFKTVGLEETTQSFLDEMVLTDTNEVRSYSRFLDLYRYLQLQIPIGYLQAYTDSYFNGFGYLNGTKYAYTKQQIKDMRSKYPYLWLLEEISIVDRSMSWN